MTARISVPVTTVWSSADAPRPQDAAIIATRPDPVAWNAALLDAPPSALHGRTVTQALLGEPAHVRAERDGWAEVILPWQPSSADPAGYPGWIPAAHLTDAEGAVSTSRVVVSVPAADVGDATLSYGTILDVVDETTDGVRVSLPGGRVGTLAESAVAPLAGHRRMSDPEALLDSARQFVGLRYLWGGTSGWGMDCSGFVHLVHRRFGITIPRDASDQIGAASRTTTASPGDLYFFENGNARISHVGFATKADDELPMLHAPDGGRLQYIEERPMEQSRRERLVSSGSFLS